jgi:F0F1-type ATP synthase epsilon subunit
MDINLTITSKSGVIYSGRCSSLTLPLDDGLYEILPNHSPAVMALAKGVLCFQSGDSRLKFSISDGILVFENNCAQVLAGSCSKS